MSLFSLSSSLRLLLALVLILFSAWPCAGRWRCHDRDEASLVAVTIASPLRARCPA